MKEIKTTQKSREKSTLGEYIFFSLLIFVVVVILNLILHTWG